jgi:hypothetical protein
MRMKEALPLRHPPSPKASALCRLESSGYQDPNPRRLGDLEHEQGHYQHYQLSIDRTVAGSLNLGPEHGAWVHRPHSFKS